MPLSTACLKTEQIRAHEEALIRESKGTFPAGGSETWQLGPGVEIITGGL